MTPYIKEQIHICFYAFIVEKMLFFFFIFYLNSIFCMYDFLYEAVFSPLLFKSSLLLIFLKLYFVITLLFSMNSLGLMVTS